MKMEFAADNQSLNACEMLLHICSGQADQLLENFGGTTLRKHKMNNCSKMENVKHPYCLSLKREQLCASEPNAAKLLLSGLSDISI